MRRKDREVQSLDEIFDILNRCDTVRILSLVLHVLPVRYYIKGEERNSLVYLIDYEHIERITFYPIHDLNPLRI